MLCAFINPDSGLHSSHKLLRDSAIKEVSLMEKKKKYVSPEMTRDHSLSKSAELTLFGRNTLD